MESQVDADAIETGGERMMVAERDAARPLPPREIKRHLARQGPFRRRRPLSGVLTSDADLEFIVRLRAALEGLGPIFADFGLYLASRADVFRPHECRELSSIADQSAALTASSVVERITSELERPADEVFAEFDETPVRCRLLYQTHRARLVDGTPVLVRVVSPNVDSRAREDLSRLRVLRRALPSKAFPLDELIADYRRLLSERLDQTREARGLEALRRATHDSDLLAVPRVYRQWTTAKVLTVEQLEGRDLETIAEAGDLGSEARQQDLAGRLSLIWLQMAFVTGTIPVDAAVVLLADGRLALTGGSFGQLASASRINLWNYVRATAGHQSERAGGYLLRELVRDSSAASERELRLRMRQAVPFRDGSWTEGGDTLAEHLLLHWRLSRACGFHSPAPLAAFFRGLVWVAGLGRRLDPEGDSLTDGLEGLHWLAGWSQFRELATPRSLGGSLEEFVSTMMELPQKLDRALSPDAGDVASRRHRRETPRSRRVWNSSATVACVLMAMAAVILLSGQMAAAGMIGDWGRRLATVFFVSLGGFLLWATRSRGGGA